MKQKLVLNVTMNEPKKRSKAMKKVAAYSGVVSVAIEGDDKSQLVVIGEEVDSVGLTRMLRKAMGHADLVSVSAVEGEKKEDEEPIAVDFMPYTHQFSVPYCVYETPRNDTCSLM